MVSLARALARRELLRPKGSAVSSQQLADRMGSVLVTIEAAAFADARPCPLCHAVSTAEEPSSLAHGPGCELDAVLAASGARSAADSERR